MLRGSEWVPDLKHNGRYALRERDGTGRISRIG